jgi:cyclic-di-GMP-binding protein
MAQEFSFDIVSKTEMQEVANAVQQAQKELAQRSKSSIELTGEELILISDDEGKLRSVKEILESRLVKRHVSLKALDYQALEQAAMGTVRQRAKIVQGIEIEKAKAVVKKIKDAKLKCRHPFSRTRCAFPAAPRTISSAPWR